MTLSPFTSTSASSSIFISLYKVLFHLSLKVLVFYWPQMCLQLWINITTASRTSVKVHDSKRAHRSHGVLQPIHRFFTLNDSPFPRACSCIPSGSALQDYNSGPDIRIFMLSLSLCIRHYYGLPGAFVASTYFYDLADLFFLHHIRRA